MDLGDPEREVTTHKTGRRRPSHTVLGSPTCSQHRADQEAAVPGAVREASLEVGRWRGGALRAHLGGESPEP